MLKILCVKICSYRHAIRGNYCEGKAEVSLEFFAGNFKCQTTTEKTTVGVDVACLALRQNIMTVCYDNM